MKTMSQSVQLSNTTTDSRFVKNGALILFRVIRSVADYTNQLPAVATRAASDVADAWEESRRPNV